MVADGTHVLLGLAIVLVLFRSRRPEPYLVSVLAAAFPDVDILVLQPLVQQGYLHGAIWTHRGVTHSLLMGVVVVAVLSSVGPWRAAAAGFLTHIVSDFFTGGVQLFAPLDNGLYGMRLGWILVNAVLMSLSIFAIVGGLAYMKYEPDLPGISVPIPNPLPERFQ